MLCARRFGKLREYVGARTEGNKGRDGDNVGCQLVRGAREWSDHRPLGRERGSLCRRRH